MRFLVVSAHPRRCFQLFCLIRAPQAEGEKRFTGNYIIPNVAKIRLKLSVFPALIGATELTDQHSPKCLL